ncbi:MAG: acido-empty-quinoprotein group A [Acidobacteria bacterium]|nr:acido-empty-quinoprotein group A [Acidobacteriota bacterium]
MCAIPAVLAGQNSLALDPRELLKPLSESWPVYSGDYSGKRFSALTEINQSTVKHLTLAWFARLTGGRGGRGGGPSIVGGVGTTEYAGSTIRGSILQVNGVLYVSAPDNVWAIDARDGREIWHYFWTTRGGTHIGNRGLGMYRDWLYLETPDNYLVSLDAKTGKERWHKEISDFDQQYFSTMAPIVVGNHVLVGTSNDLDAPGFLQSFDPEDGSVQWKFYTVPMKEGDPGLETWKDLDAASHGGGHAWNPGSYDPETNLYIFGTGNPTPAYTSQSRGEGDNLYTCSIVAVNVNTGKMAWYYQTSPHDTHDWDSAQTPVLVDAGFNGRPRKLVMTAGRNGYFFVLDRVTGEHLVTSQFSDTVNWARGLNEKGQPIRNPAKDFHIGGALVSGNNGGATNWPPPSFSPQTGLFYVPLSETYAMYYLTETDPRGAMGLGGKEEAGVGSMGSYLAAIDYKTGKTVWKHRYPGTGGGGASGLLTTAGGLLFGGDISGNLVAYNSANGKILWHSRIGSVSNAPQTYLLDGHQYLLVAAGDTLFSFTLAE